VTRIAFCVLRLAFGVRCSVFGVRCSVLCCLQKSRVNPIRGAFPELSPVSAGLEVRISGASYSALQPWATICSRLAAKSDSLLGFEAARQILATRIFRIQPESGANGGERFGEAA